MSIRSFLRCDICEYEKFEGDVVAASEFQGPVNLKAKGAGPWVIDLGYDFYFEHLCRLCFNGLQDTINRFLDSETGKRKPQRRAG